MTGYQSLPDAEGPADRGLRIAREAGRRIGLDPTGARVLRVRSSVHVELPRADVVARVEPPGREASARCQVRVARTLAASRAPVARLERAAAQPVKVEGGAVTLWRRVRSIARPTASALGRAVRQIHDATRDGLPSGLPAIDPFAEVHRYLAGPSPWSGSPAVDALRRQTERCARRWPAAVRDDPLGRRLLHGDVHLDNARVTDRGLVLIDLEDSGIGPASWDCAPLAVGVTRYGLPRATYREFLDGYGAEPPAGPGFELMCRVYELFVTAWAIRCGADSPEMEREAAARVACLVDGDTRPWKLL